MNDMKMFLSFSVYQLIKNGNKIVDTDKYEVFEDKNGNRYLHGKDNTFNMY